MELSGQNVLMRWRDAQRQLDEAIQCYLQRAADIEAATSNPIHYSSDHQLLETAIQEAYQDLHVLPFRADQLLQARTTLNRLRNRSTSLTPVNRLPLEVLLQIFRLTVWQTPCARCDPSVSNPTLAKYDHLKALLTLTHVCKHWRKIAINMPSFWSHVGLALGAMQRFVKSYDGVQACLQRAHNSPICIWIDGDDNIADEGLNMLIDLLHSHIDNLESFTLLNHRNHPRILRFISLWLTHGRTGSVRTLTVWLETTMKQWKLYSNNIALSEQRVASFLEPIRVLRLRGACFDWDSPVYHNLVVLRLRNTRSPLATPQLRRILSACPQLHTLQLRDMDISAGDDSSHPVVLADLKHLDVQGIQSGGLHELFTMVNSQQSQEMTLVVDLYRISDNESSAIQSFLARSNVTRLALLGIVDGRYTRELLSAAANLNILILGCGGKRKSLDIFSRILSLSGGQGPSHCSRLHALHLKNGVLGTNTVQEAVEAYLRRTKPRPIPCIYDLFDEELLSQLDPFENDVEYQAGYGEAFIDIPHYH